MVPTGVKAYIQDNEYLGIHIRSSMAVKRHLRLVNNEGIVDADYYNNPDNEGHLLLALANDGDGPWKRENGWPKGSFIPTYWLTMTPKLPNRNGAAASAAPRNEADHGK